MPGKTSLIKTLVSLDGERELPMKSEYISYWKSNAW